MIGREDPKENDLFFTCSLIEYIGRVTKNKRHVVVDILGRERIEKIYNLADVYHCIDIAYTAEDFIEEAGINEGDFDNIKSKSFSLNFLNQILQLFTVFFLFLYHNARLYLEKIYSFFSNHLCHIKHKTKVQKEIFLKKDG